MKLKSRCAGSQVMGIAVLAAVSSNRLTGTCRMPTCHSSVSYRGQIIDEVSRLQGRYDEHANAPGVQPALFWAGGRVTHSRMTAADASSTTPLPLRARLTPFTAAAA